MCCPSLLHYFLYITKSQAGRRTFGLIFGGVSHAASFWQRRRSGNQYRALTRLSAMTNVRRGKQLLLSI